LQTLWLWCGDSSDAFTLEGVERQAPFRDSGLRGVFCLEGIPLSSPERLPQIFFGSLGLNFPLSFRLRRRVIHVQPFTGVDIKLADAVLENLLNISVTHADGSLQKGCNPVVVVSDDQCLGTSSDITPAEQVQADFAPQRAFVREAAGAAVARAEPHFSFIPIGGVATKLERCPADARLFILCGYDDFYCLHVVSSLGRILNRFLVRARGA
jgi:hypothetical protein